MDPSSLARAVEDAFVRTAHGLERWEDPHPPPDRVVADEEYSRVTNPARWRIVGARVDAWIDVLVTVGAATVEREAQVEWVEPPGPVLTRSDLVRPVVAGGLPLVVGRSRVDAVDDAGVALGVGVPAAFLHAIPDCGCDACDSGSADVIDEVDTWLGGIVRGELRHLVRPRSTITVIGSDLRRASYRPALPAPTGGRRWSAAPAPAIRPGDRPPGDRRPGRRRPGGRLRRPFDVDAVLADPTGWREWSGPSWLDA